MATANNNIYRQVYNAYEDINLLTGTDRITCVFWRRGILSAAFNAENELLSIHYAGYGTDRPVWELDFFEPLFAQEPMLVKHEKITKVFFCSSHQLVIPEELYELADAEVWFRNMHFTEQNDVIRHYNLKEQNAYYLYSVPMNIKALVKIYCPQVPILPLQAYQFAGNYTRGVKLNCFIAPDLASATLYHYGALLWHRVFNYGAAEDIAYEIRVVCEEHKINADKVSVSCTALTASEYDVINQLSQYFAGITTAGGHIINSMWSPALSLIKELESCE